MDAQEEKTATRLTGQEEMPAKIIRKRVQQMYIPDNYDRFLQHEHEQEKALVRLPVCHECKEPIQSDYCYGENGIYICESCLKAYYRHDVSDLISEL